LATGELSANEAESIAEHVADCQECATLFDVQELADPLLSALRNQPRLHQHDSVEVKSLQRRIGAMVNDAMHATRWRQASTPSETAGDTRAGGSSRELSHWLDAPHSDLELGRMGDYRVIEQIGRGGMGIVLKAEDTKLGRIVAIKLIRDARSFDAQYISRFEQEAKSMAQLRHPNVVSVFEVGSHRNRPYLVLEYIAGGTLAERIDDRPQDPRHSARFMSLLGRAVQYAHDQGVIHRDLKPANILIATPDTNQNSADTPSSLRIDTLQDLNPKIADFGLARHTEADGLTQTGDLLGTPSYMAPELTRGLQQPGLNDRQCDVYSLGAILYELLTGRPPFLGPTVPDTFEQVRHQEPVPPRQLQPNVPQDLETICLRCLAKEPARRYATAGDLADELDRFLNNLPILARPAGWIERTLKWTRRHPALAALTFVSILASAVLITGALLYERALRNALREAQASTTAAQTAKQQAENERAIAFANYREARDAMDAMLRIIQHVDLKDVPKVHELQRHQQEESLKFLEASARRQGTNPEVRYDAARAAFDAGSIRQFLGESEEARELYQRSATQFAELSSDFPLEVDYVVRQAQAISSLASLNNSQSQPLQGIELGEQAIQLLQTRESDLVGNERAMVTLATVHFTLAAAFFGLRSSPPESYTKEQCWHEAEQHYLKVHELLSSLLEDNPEADDHRTRLAKTQANLSILYQQHTDQYQAECEKFHAMAETTMESILADDPDFYELACDLALLRVNWAYYLNANDQVDTALADLAQNVTQLNELLELEPQFALAREMLYRTHGTRANILDARHRYVESAEDWDQVVALTPEGNRSKMRLLRGITRARTPDFAEAVADAERLADEPDVRDNPQYLWNLAKICSIAMTSSEQHLPADLPDRSSVVDEYGAKGNGYLARSRAAAGVKLWLELYGELALDADFAALRNHVGFGNLGNVDTANPASEER
jgi:serine/threonine protein kinase